MAADSRIFTGFMLAGRVGLVVAALVACDEIDRGRLRSDEEYEGFRSCESARSVADAVCLLLLARLMLLSLPYSSMSEAFFAKPSALFAVTVVMAIRPSIVGCPSARGFIRSRFLPHCFSELKENV